MQYFLQLSELGLHTLPEPVQSPLVVVVVDELDDEEDDELDDEEDDEDEDVVVSVSLHTQSPWKDTQDRSPLHEPMHAPSGSLKH